MMYPLLPATGRHRHARPPRALGAALVLACLMFAPTQPGRAENAADASLERQVKAAFLYRFTEYVTWPDQTLAGSPHTFLIAVIGNAELAQELRQITNGRAIEGRPVEIRSLRNAAQLSDEDLIFVSDGARQQIAQIVRSAPPHTLIVTESDGALRQGSIINFVIVDDRVRFEISLPAAERHGLRLSSRLLAVARAVHSGPP